MASTPDVTAGTREDVPMDDTKQALLDRIQQGALKSRLIAQPLKPVIRGQLSQFE